MKKSVQIILMSILVLGGTTAVLFWLVDLKIQDVEANIKKTGTLDNNIKTLFQNSKQINEYPYEQGLIDWGKSYLLVKQQYIDGSTVIYDTEWNTALETESNYPGVSCKGVIVAGPNLVEIGNYKNNSGDIVGTASRYNYILYYLDIDKKTILAIDTVLGGDPPQRSNSNSGHDVGEPPSIQEVVQSIKKRLP